MKTTLINTHDAWIFCSAFEEENESYEADVNGWEEKDLIILNRKRWAINSRVIFIL